MSTPPAAAQDPFSAVLGDERGRAARPEEPWAVVELHIGSPHRPDTVQAEDLATFLESEAAAAAVRARDIRALRDTGWRMDPPAIRVDNPQELLSALQAEVDTIDAGGCPTRPLRFAEEDGGYLDFDIRFRKRYSTPQHAEADLRALGLGAGGQSNWDFGWDEQPDGATAWWQEL